MRKSNEYSCLLTSQLKGLKNKDKKGCSCQTKLTSVNVTDRSIRKEGSVLQYCQSGAKQHYCSFSPLILIQKSTDVLS